MNPINHQDDPRLTAYALGELSENERAQVDELLRRDEAARKVVNEIESTAQLVERQLKQEAAPVPLD